MSFYTASPKDFKAIEQAIEIVRKPELEFIFENKKILDRTSIVSFDANFLYIWTGQEFKNLHKIKSFMGLHFYKIKHNLKISEENRHGWKAGIWINEVGKLLPIMLRENNFDNPVICGSLLGDFIKIQTKIKSSIYRIKESYLATIMHEFAHAYYSSFRNWWFSNKSKNIELINEALNLYRQGRRKKVTKIEIPIPFFFSEVFAFCAEYEASKLFFPKHKKNIDKYAIDILKKIVNREIKVNLDIEDSIFSDKTAHYAALAIGKILTEKYPKDWPSILLRKPYI